MAVRAEAAHRALLIGINDYTASRLGTPIPNPSRDWPNLAGAVTDVEILKQMLPQLYGVDPRRIVALTDQAATHDAILQELRQMTAATAKDDDVLFYFAGHGSQQRNSESEERDKLDETIVPADSRVGADDIRDKVLRVEFNRILARGARLTVIFDSCHSGSAARGLVTGARSRGIRPDLRDVADSRRYGPPPEAHGALVLSATEDAGEAHETRDALGRIHGVFSWAWIRSMRDATSGEPAADTFARAQARMRTEPPFQSPVIAGLPEAKLAPFLGKRVDRRGDVAVVGVGRVQGRSVVLQGGWANGLSPGMELREPVTQSRLKITEVRGLAQSTADVIEGGVPKTGALVEVIGWTAPPGRPLRVSMPRVPRPITVIESLARRAHAAAERRGVRWVANPIDSTPSHLLRWSGGGWEIVGPRGMIARIGSDDAAIAAIARLPAGTSLFVQFPAPTFMAAAIDAPSAPPDEADYILVGRFVQQKLKYAWLRPVVKRRDRRQSALPLQTAWTVSAPDLGKAIQRLRRIHGWLTLESPPQSRFPYRLEIRRKNDGRLVGDGESIIGETSYKLYLRGVVPMPAAVRKRYIYAFVLDGNGRSHLLYPPGEYGIAENRLPDAGAPMDIPLDGSAFEADEPYGIDTYMLLSTDEPLHDPSILEWDGVRRPRAPRSPLEELLAMTVAGTRATEVVTPATWSIERLSRESVRARAPKTNR